MRALNSRRLRPTRTFHLFPRSLLCLLFLLFVLRVGQPRSVSHDEQNQVQPVAKLSPGAKKDDFGEINSMEIAELKPEESTEDVGEICGPLNVNCGDEEHDLVVFEAESRKKRENRKTKKVVDVVGASDEGSSEVLKQEDEEAGVVKKRRRNDVALVGKSEVRENEGIPVGQIGEATDEGIRRFDSQVDADGVAPGPFDARHSNEEYEGSVKAIEPKESEISNAEESRIQDDEKSKQALPDYFRKSGKLEDDDSENENENENEKEYSDKSADSEERKEFFANREYRSFVEPRGKSKRKSSTVYLNAEEKKISDGEQQSIVDGQIKKLISIRDDALDAQKTDKIDETKVLNSKRQVETNEWLAFNEEKVRGANKVKRIKLTDVKRSAKVYSFLKRWKARAISLQSQIEDSAFVQRLRKRTTKVLPEIPRFTKNTLESRVRVLRERHERAWLNREIQSRIIGCAELLVASRERRSLIVNSTGCVRPLSVLNCMRIFVRPFVMDNLPESIGQSLGNLPIEINVFDVFQGSKQKSGRVEDLHRVRLLTPDVAVYNILQDALESYPNDETLVSYIDPKNDTLKELLTFDQLTILQMAEKFLPQALRREYSDKMFSCVRRFEYFSCVKYFAWPLVKQYFPALPAFPDYQCWYPIADLSPQYPIFPFPSFSEEIGELPEVVDADGTRTRKPRPEALIIQVLQNTLKEQPRISTSPSFLDQSMDTYITLIPEDQLLTINMAEQLIPISYRPEFVQKTVRCMKEYNYLSCFKYSAWPTVKRFIPTLPDIFSLMPEFQGAGLSSDVGSYVPQLSAYSNLNFYVPVGATTVPKDTEAPAYSSLKNRGTLLRSSDQLETKILEILQKVYLTKSYEQAREIPSFILTGNAVRFVTFTKRQIEILHLTESLLPPSARATFITEFLSYLQKSNDFIDAARYVIWPTIAKYQPTLSEFPRSEVPDRAKEPVDPQGSSEIEESSINPGLLIQERVVSNVEKEKAAGIFFRDKESRNRVPNVPVISVSGTRFVPIFSELPESVIYNILRSVQLQSIKSTSATSSFTTKNQEFLDLLTVQQANIIGIVDTLLPDSVRPDFVNSMLSCLRTENFLICTRDVVWPTLSLYFPWLPNFPDFGIVSSVRPSGSPSVVSNSTLTESSSSSDTPALSETDVKTGQHGDTTVTITDTRFFPIYNELPETIISNILKAVQFSIPNLPGSPAPVRTREFSPHLSDHQINIINIAENLLPIPTRLEYIENMKPCIEERNFLQCSRDVTWPTIAKFYPWLPSFPNFGTLQNLPDESSSQAGLIKEAELLDQAEGKIENILSDVLGKSPELERSYLNLTDSVASSLNKRQINIIRLVERAIPDAARQSYVTRMQNCITGYNFLACTNNIIWPILKQYSFSLPDFSSIGDLFSQFPGIVQIPPDLPDFGSIAGNIPSISQLPGILQIPGISQLSTGFPTLSTQPGGLAARSDSQNSQSNTRAEAQEGNSKGDPTITPSVDNDGAVPGYANQPPGILIDISNEKVDLSDTGREAATIDSKSSEEVKSRQRRSTIDVLGSYYDNEEADTADSLASSKSSTLALPNITESEYLRILIKMKENLRFSNANPSKSEQYLADKLNSTMRNSLTADQYEILKIIQDLEDRPSSKGLTQQVIQCLLSLSFIRCLGIFVWPLVVSNLPSLPGLPSLPSFGILGRNFDTDSQVRNFFGMSTTDFEQKLLERKESIESFLLDWYRKLAEDKFQTDVGYLKIKGYGNNQLGISFSGFREGRGAKLKDNKNLPSILTIISDIMEEVLDQRPEGDRAKKDKEKRERSIKDSRETDIQFLKNSEEIVDIKRSIDDDEIITLFLDRIRPNDSEIENDDTKYTSDDAYDAFGVLFGTKLHDKLAGEIESLDAELRMEKAENGPIEPIREVDIVSLESEKDSDELKVLPTKSQVAYDFEKESSRDQEERRRRKRAKNFFKSFLEKYSNRRSKDDSNAENFDNVGDNKIIEEYEKDAKSTLVVQLPRLHEEVVSRKVTNSMIHMGKAFKTKMTQMMPGFGLVLSFLLQMALAHARATASMAGMISNMALGTAMFGMIRDSFFGSSGHPKIKYVYDNDKNGPGISWPTQYESGSRYYG